MWLGTARASVLRSDWAATGTVRPNPVGLCLRDELLRRARLQVVYQELHSTRLQRERNSALTVSPAATYTDVRRRVSGMRRCGTCRPRLRTRSLQASENQIRPRLPLPQKNSCRAAAR